MQNKNHTRYFIGRTRAFKAVVYISLFLLSIFQYSAIFESGQRTSPAIESMLVRMSVVFLLGILLLSLRENIILITANLIAVALLPIFIPNIDSLAVLAAMGFILLCGVIIVAGIRYRDLSELDRRNEFLGEKKFSDHIINGLPGIFFMYDMQGCLVRWNKEHEEVSGFTFEEMAGLHLNKLMELIDNAPVESLLQRVQKTGKTEAEINLFTKNGNKIPFYISVLSDELEGKPYMIGFGIAITGLKRVEEANRAIVENSLQGLAIYQKGRIVFANPAYAQTLGYSLDEIYNMDAEQVENLIFVEDRQLLNMRTQAALSGDEVAPRYETRVIRKDGSLRWLDVSMSIIKYQDQIAIQVAYVDISDRKLMETEQARLIWELETKNAELERFSYTVSHDLKSPLITIRGFLGFLEKDVAINNVARLKADVQRIYEATEKMQRLLNDLLMLSRVGRVTNPPEKVSFVSIAKEAADLAGGQIRARGVAVKISREMPEVYVDLQRIVEVVQNLLDNAVKFMGNQPAPRIEVGCRGSENGDPVLYVRDNGIGIEPQYHARIFGLFNKLNPDTDGTGIGLALVKRIIEFHNGHIWVESQQSQGTTFYFTLPGVEKT